MDRKTLTELDYYRIRDTVAGYCVSTESSASLQNREPLSDIQEIERLKQFGNEWYTYLQSTRQPSLSSWPEITKLIPVMSTEGATLSQEQLYAFALFCVSVKHACETLASAAGELNISHLSALAGTIPSLAQPYAEISRIIDANGSLKDLPELRTIRAAIAGYKRDITNLMHKYTSDSSLSSVLESNVPAFRADRQVLAVHANHRNAIKGIIHEVSQSGQTVYIEPDDVVRKNNDLVQEEFHLQQEIRRIFRELTAKLLPYAPLFSEALPVMIELDTSCASAKWGIEHQCVYALPCSSTGNGTGEEADTEPPLILKARHPLLGTKAVPVDVLFMTGKRVLIITGPNTGGKTVTLKTIALFALLNQSGFPVPAAEGTRLPVFKNVFADIGDEQSLDQSLSTFSGHMKNIAAAVKYADADSLVLLDELGSGTDPQEGGAIAMAVLDTLIEHRSFVLVTTHHGILKNYGYTHKECINASVDFNNDTLAPTYRLVMGVPGESHALDIARRSGLPDAVTKKAQSYIANEQADVSALIKGLTAKHAELDRLQQEFSRKEHDIHEIQRRADLKELRLRQKEMELKQYGHREAQKFLEESRKELENLVRTIKEGEVTHEKAVSVKQYIAGLSSAVQKQDADIEQGETSLAADQAAMDAVLEKEKTAAKAGKKAAKKDTKKRMKNADALAAAQSPAQVFEAQSPEKLVFKPGADVLAGTARRHGILMNMERKGLWCVQFGNIRMSIKQKDLTLIPPSQVVDNTPSVTVDLAEEEEGKDTPIDSGLPGNKPAFELRLIGLRCDEAIKLLERQLDLCTMKNFREFSIIHGKGTGILQQAVQDYLSHYPGVAEFHFAPPEDGGTGKTYVRMY